MQITIKPDGEIRMDTNGSTPAEIAGTILCIQKELRKQVEQETRLNETPVSLNTLNAQTWDWLVDNDTENGVHTQAVAKHFGISKEAAQQRCQRLVEEGHARRVGSGRYRAVTG